MNWREDETVDRYEPVAAMGSWLTDAGMEVHWSTQGQADAPDTEIMTFARANGYVVLTRDLDFSAIPAAIRSDKPSVVQLRADDVNPETIGDRVILALSQMSAQLDEGALLTIDPVRTRLRILPFQLE